MKIYVASSWRNDSQPNVVDTLRHRGHEVYDFRNPPNGTGFGWQEVMPSFDINAQLSDAEEYVEALNHPRSVEGFDSDFDAMKWADACILVLPCGRSAHLEMGWAVGARKRTAIMLDGPVVTPELMYKMVDYVAPDLGKLLDWVADWPKDFTDAVHRALAESGRQMNGGEVHAEMNRRWPNAFPLVSTLDVIDELRNIYGQPVSA